MRGSNGRSPAAGPTFLTVPLSSDPPGQTVLDLDIYLWEDNSDFVNDVIHKCSPKERSCQEVMLYSWRIHNYKNWSKVFFVQNLLILRVEYVHWLHIMLAPSNLNQATTKTKDAHLARRLLRCLDDKGFFFPLSLPSLFSILNTLIWPS